MSQRWIRAMQWGFIGACAFAVLGVVCHQAGVRGRSGKPVDVGIIPTMAMVGGTAGAVRGWRSS